MNVTVLAGASHRFRICWVGHINKNETCTAHTAGMRVNCKSRKRS
jgi:hypothetical protein